MDKEACAQAGLATSGGRKDRRFNGFVIAMCAAVAFAGFARSFYMRGFFHPTRLTLLLYLHGAAMTAWFVLTGAQFSLAAAGQTRLHRRLGWAAALVAPLVLATGLTTLFSAAARLAPPLGTAFLALFVAFDGLSLILFGAFAGAAIGLRNRRGDHARLVLLATLALLPPAVGRITLLFTRQGSEIAVLIAMIAAAGLIVAVDAARSGRVHPVFGWGGAAIAAANLTAYIAQTSG